MNWRQLKSGTDVRGVAVEGKSPVTLTDPVVGAIAQAFAVWLAEKKQKSVSELTLAVGRDSRISGPRIRDAVTAALNRAGVNVLDCGLASTPSMFMTTVDLPCDGSIQITASHHPYDRNGLKFFTRDGGLDAPDIDALLSLCEANQLPADAEIPGTVTPTDYMTQYAAHLRDLIQKGVNAEDYEHPLAGFKIAVDAGNGAGGFYARDVLAPLGADVSGSQFLEPDGMFPNHIPNPENEEAMASICKAVVDSHSDLGVIFDTDVDRGGAVDARGEEINRNRLVAIASVIALEGNEGGTIVTDSITSDGLKVYLEKTLGGHHHRFKRGYKNVINEAIRLNNEGINCPLAIETSGHAALMLHCGRIIFWMTAHIWSPALLSKWHSSAKKESPWTPCWNRWQNRWRQKKSACPLPGRISVPAAKKSLLIWKPMHRHTAGKLLLITGKECGFPLTVKTGMAGSCCA